MLSDDILVVGGGVVGLSIALELAEAGSQVRLIDRESVGQQASWAGAGMIPPGEIHFQNKPYREMAKLSAQIWSELSEKLFSLSGIRNEYKQCGAVILSEKSLKKEQVEWNRQGVITEEIDHAQRAGYHLSESASSGGAYFLPGQAQVRNPRHIKALKQACISLGVKIVEHQQVRQFEIKGDQVLSVQTEKDRFCAGRILIATGAWSQEIGQLLNVSIPVMPVRGQIVLLNTPGQLKQIIEQGKRYLVPRVDGRLLIGATEEHVGFEQKNTASAVSNLIQFATDLVPSLSDCQVEKFWFGFRPGSPDKLPILGQLTPWENVFAATGQYRAGLSLSPITGRLMRQLLLGQPLEIPLNDFLPDRF